MGILSRIKAQFDFNRWRTASTKLVEIGNNEAKPWPFDRFKAVEQLQSWAYRCAIGNAQQAASIPLRLYVRKMSDAQMKARGLKSGCVWKTRPISRQRMHWLKGEYLEHRPSVATLTKAMNFGDDFEEVTEANPIIDVLRQANSFWNGFNLSVFRFLSQELTGDAYLHPIMSKELSRPTELWPMLPQWTHVVPGKTDEDQFIKGYNYGAITRTEARFTPDEVLHFRYPSMTNLYYGKGKVEAAWTILGLHHSERAMHKALFDNHARPDFMVSVKGAKQEQVDAWAAKTASLLRGAKNAGKLLAVAGDVTATPLAFPPSEFGTTMEVVEEIAGVFGYPITKLKGNDPNRSNADAGDYGWMKDTILPMLVQDEEALNQNGYLALFNDGALVEDAMLAYDDPVPKNKQYDLDRRVKLSMAGVLTINEARMEEGLPEIEGGEVPRYNGVPFDLMGRQQGGFGGLFGNQEPKNVPRETLLISHSQKSQAMGLAVGCDCPAHAAKAPADDTVREGEREAPIDAIIRRLNGVFGRVEAAIEAVITGQKRTEPLSKRQLDEIERIIQGMPVEIRAAVRPELERIFEQAGRFAMAQLSLPPESFNMAAPQLQQVISGFTEQLAGGVTQTTVQAIRASLGEGIASGEAPADLARRVRETGLFSPHRSEAIARTESARAYGRGTIESWKQSGVVRTKRFFLSADACKFCQAADALIGDKEFGLDEPFLPMGSVLVASDGATMSLDYADMQEGTVHPNCRCGMLATLKE